MAARDSEATKERILAAALHEFAAKGIAGARVDAIAKRAGVNKAMLYYYFESKEGLFREVLGQPLTDQWESLRSMDVASPDRLVDRTEDRAPDLGYVRLLAWESLEGDPLQPEDEELRRVFFETWVSAVDEQQRAGVLPDDLDASQLVLAEVCLTLGPLILPQLARLITGYPLDDPRFVKARREFLHALTERLDREPARAVPPNDTAD
jgi:AcrR family transcriptional regulator